MGYITQEGLQNLTKYQYQAGQITWLEKKIDYFWEWLVKLIPKNIAPNLMTFIGWCFILASYGNMLRYDLTFDKYLPSWCFFFAAFCIFCFTTLDAIDGKQARRTHGGTPLGQLFDHGCDSYTLTFLMLGLCEALQIQKNAVFLLFIITQIAFFTSNWIQNHTGVLNTGVGQFGVIQGEHICILVHVLTGVYGQKIWQGTLLKLLPRTFVSFLKQNNPWLAKTLNIKLGITLVYLFSIIIALLTIAIFIKTIQKLNNKFESISEYLSSFLLIIIQICWSTTQIYKQYSGLILVNFGFIASLILCKLIICTVTKMQVQKFHYQIIPCMIATVIILFLQIFHANLLYMKIVFWFLFTIDLIWVFSFLIRTIKQITSFLGIHCFSMQRRRVLQRPFHKRIQIKQK